MKLMCDIVQDLLPLYEENLCSAASREAIEEHMQECASCRELSDRMRSFQVPELPKAAISNEDKIIVKSFRKVHRRWIASLLVLLLMIPMLTLTVNQVRKEGVCFTNLDEIWTVNKYLHALEQGDFEKAAACMDYEQYYNEIQELLLMEQADFEKTFRPIALSGKTWMVTEDYYARYFAEENNEQAIWAGLIYNTVANVLIPQEIWEEMMTLEPNVFYKNDDGSYEMGGWVYKPIQNEWGTFMANSVSRLDDAGDYCDLFALLPAEIYEAGKDTLKAQASNSYHYIQELYGPAADMRLEEFKVFIQAHYIKQLQDCFASGYSVEITGLAESYYIAESGNWHIGYGVVIHYGKDRYSVRLIYSVNDGRIINLGAITHAPELQDELVDPFIEALILSFPD